MGYSLGKKKSQKKGLILRSCESNVIDAENFVFDNQDWIIERRDGNKFFLFELQSHGRRR